MSESRGDEAPPAVDGESGEPNQSEEGVAQIPDPAEKEVRENEPGIGGGA